MKFAKRQILLNLLLVQKPSMTNPLKLHTLIEGRPYFLFLNACIQTFLLINSVIDS